MVFSQILQLTSLLPTAEHFSILLRDALKAQLAEMKLLKPFLPTLYSEYLLTQPAFLHNHHPLQGSGPGGAVSTPGLEADKVDLIGLGSDLGTGGKESRGAGGGTSGSNSNAPAADARGPGGDGKGAYERGLGETFGYPGDARKLRERSKIKLWREYFVTHGRNLTRTFRSTSKGVETLFLCLSLFLESAKSSTHLCAASSRSPALPAVSTTPPGRSPIQTTGRAMGDAQRVIMQVKACYRH